MPLLINDKLMIKELIINELQHYLLLILKNEGKEKVYEIILLNKIIVTIFKSDFGKLKTIHTMSRLAVIF